MALIVTSLLHCGGVSRVRGRLSQCLGLGLIGIVGDGRRLLVEIDLDVTHAGHLLQRLVFWIVSVLLLGLLAVPWLAPLFY